MGRNSLVEAGRVIAAVSIIWYHSLVEPLHDLAYGGLSFFIVALAFYWKPVEPITASLRLLAGKMALPFAACFLLYGIANLSIGRPFVNLEDGWISAFLTGPSYHLWFLSWAFFALFLLNLLIVYGGRKVAGIFAAVALALLIATAQYWPGWSSAAPSPAPQYLHAMIPFLAGVVFSVCRTWIVHALVAGLIVLDYALGQAPFFYSYIAGITLFLLCLHAGEHLPLPRLGNLNVSAMMFFVYLIHPLFLGIFRYTGIHVNVLTVGAIVFLSVLSAFLWMNLRNRVLAPHAA